MNINSFDFTLEDLLLADAPAPPSRPQGRTPIVPFLENFGGGSSHDGRSIILMLRSAAGESTIAIRAKDIRSFIQNVREIAMEAFTIRQGHATTAGVTMRDTKARPVTKIEGSVAKDGTPILTVELNGKNTINLDLRQVDIPALTAWLQSLPEATETEVRPSK